MEGSYGVSLGWALAPFLVVGALILVLRWAFSERQDSLLARRPRRGREDDYGLMAALVTPRDAAEGEAICRRLARFGIKGRLVGTDSGLRVMVWEQDLNAAQWVLAEDDPPG